MLKKILSLILATVTCVGFLAGCKDNNSNNSSDENRPTDTQPVKKYAYTDGVHDFTATEANGYIVKNGKTEYAIVVPENLDSNLIVACNDLKSLFEEATGAKLSMITEKGEGLTHNANQKYISIGNTKLFASSGLQIDTAQLGQQGVRILTKDNNVYINSGGSLGCVFGVYDFLEILFNFDQFAEDCYYLDKATDVKLRNFNVTDIPDIEMRIPGWGAVEEGKNNLRFRMRMPYNQSTYIMSVGDVENGATRQSIHNSFNILPPKSSPSAWIADSGQQLCYTAHGDPEQYEAMVDRIAYVMEQSLIEYPVAKYPLLNTLTLTMQDGPGYCNCSACNKAKEKYGTASGAVIVMCNEVMERLDAWMELPENEPYKRDDLTLMFFAYMGFIDAPAHYDEQQGKYVVNHPDLEMRDDVVVYYAVLSGFQYMVDVYDPINESGLENSLKWFDIASSMYLWTYGINFSSYWMPDNCLTFFDSDAYQLFAYGKAKFLYNQCAWNSANFTAFQGLKAYVESKLSWNVTLDADVLIEKWFNAMFKDAAPIMKSLYQAESNYSLILMEKAGRLNSATYLVFNVDRMEYWPYEMLLDWIDMIDDARVAIAGYKLVNPELYTMLKTHIDLEWISPAYALVNIYGESYLKPEVYREMIEYFKSDIYPLAPLMLDEDAGEDGTIQKWIETLK